MSINDSPDKSVSRQDSGHCPPESKVKDTPDTADTNLKKLLLRLGIVAAVVAVLGSTIEILDKILPETPIERVKYYGVLRDEDGIPVSNARILVFPDPQSDKPIGSGHTLSNGEFSIGVSLPYESNVWVKITLDGIVGFEGYQLLSGSSSPPFRRSK